MVGAVQAPLVGAVGLRASQSWLLGAVQAQVLAVQELCQVGHRRGRSPMVGAVQAPLVGAVGLRANSRASQSWLPRAVHEWLQGAVQAPLLCSPRGLPRMQLALLHVPKDQVDLSRFLPALCQLRFACGIPTLQPLPARCQTMLRSLVQLMFPAQRWTPLSFCQPMPAGLP